MDSNEQIRPVEVFCGTLLEAEMVKNFLARAGIKAYLNDEFIGVLAPWYTAPGGAGAVKVVVSSVDYEEGRLLVKKYEDNRKKDKI